MKIEEITLRKKGVGSPREGAELDAGTWIGTAGDFNGYMTYPHSHLTLPMNREPWRLEFEEKEKEKK